MNKEHSIPDRQLDEAGIEHATNEIQGPKGAVTRAEYGSAKRV